MGAAGSTSEHDIAVREQVDRISSSALFASADRRVRLLRFLVDHGLRGDVDSLKESVIAIEVFDRAADHDPKLDSAVRVEMGRLRSRLIEYYAQAGQADPVRIEIPKGSYQPVFRFTSPLPEATAARSPAPILLQRWRVFALAAALLILGLAAWRFIVQRGSRAPTSVAVLPFLNLSGDSANEYLSDSLADELTGVLAEVKELQVVARTSSFQFKGKNTDVRQIGRQLGAGAVLEGSLSKPAGQFRITVQLIRAVDGYHLWSHAYDASPGDLQRVEKEIAEAAIQTLLLGRRNAAKRTAAELMTTDSPEALLKSVDLAKQAIAKDPKYPLPYEAIGVAEWTLGTLTVQPEKLSEDRAMDALDQAIALNPRYGDARALRASIIYNRDWDWPRAEGEYRQALGLGSAKAHSLYGWGLATRGRFTEAQEHLRLAEELDPLGAGPLQNRSGAYYMARDYVQARRELGRWLELDPRAFYALLLLSGVEFNEGHCAAAQATADKMAGYYPRLPATQGTRMLLAALCGHPEPARQFLAGVEKNGGPGIARAFIASVYAALHDADHVFQYLGQAVDQHEAALLWLKFEPSYAEFRRDPRYLDLLQRVGLPH